MDQNEELRRWRLVLGHMPEQQRASALCAFSLQGEDQQLDAALAALYDAQEGEGRGLGADLSGSAPKLTKWMADVRSLFPEDIVAVVQKDAIERKGLKKLLLEPEIMAQLSPDVGLISQLIALKDQIPKDGKAQAMLLVRQVVEELQKKLEPAYVQAVRGALNKRQHSPLPSASALDIPRTLRRNLHTFDRASKQLRPEKFYFYDRRSISNRYHIILDMDQSGSMADSCIYGAIIGAIFASLPALETRVVAFDTSIVDLTELHGHDPVDMIWGIQLGGGTDINKSVAYCSQYISPDPKQTLFILLTDLCEGGNEEELVLRLQTMVENGVKVLCLLALADHGKPYYDKALAERLVNIGIPCFACAPTRLPEFVEMALKGGNFSKLIENGSL